jgi:hypothetical protein
MKRFPSARFLFVVRDPRDNLRSILNRLQLPGDLEALSAEQWDAISPAWRMVVDGRWLGLDAGSYIEMLARRWCLCAEIYLHNSEHMALVRYEEFRSAKVATLRALAQSFGWSERHDIRARVDVQFQPAGDRGVGWEEFFGTANLHRVEEICAALMEQVGYGARPRPPQETSA